MRGLEGPSVDPSHGGFFREIEALSKALNVESKPLRRRGRAAPPPGSHSDRESQRRDEKGGLATVGCAASRSLSTGRSFAPSDSDRKEKKSSSLWNWKPLKALSHIRHRRFDCIFSLCVHSIENIPPALSNASLCVHWRRTTADSGSAHARPAAVHRGTAKFDETLTYSCSVYGSRSRAQGSAKYEARHFLIYATVVGAPGLDLGKHRVDLTRLLPLNLEDLEEGKNSGKWSTSFRLSGKAIGASLSVSFGFSVVAGDEKVLKPGGDRKILEVFGEKEDGVNRVTRLGSLPGMKSQFVDDVKARREIMETSLDVVSNSIVSRVEAGVIVEQENSAEMKCCVLPEPCERNVQESEEHEFMVIERGIEIAKEDNINVSVTEKLDSERAVMQDCSGIEVIGEETNQKEDENSYCDQETGELATSFGESTVKDLQSTFFGISINELEEMGYPELKVEASEKLSFDDVELKHQTGSMKCQSRSLDDLTEEVATEFLSMLDVDHSSMGLSSEGDPESPREQLWKQFKRESLGPGGGMFGLDIDVDEEINWGNNSEVFDFSSIVYDADCENQNPSQAMEIKSMARKLEDAETEALLREWGLTEKIFDSPPGSRNGFGSPIDLPPEEPTELPPLGEYLGPFVQTKDGGFLRSMSPNLFKDSKSNGNLIMQVSKPVVMPAEMGSDNMEILQHLASIGVEKLSMQASKLMPLEEITGGFMQQLAWEAVPDAQAFQRQGSLVHQNREDDSVFDLNTFGRKGKYVSAETDRGGESNCEYVSLEDLAPLAMDKIEALSIEGLKIQSGMSDEEAPSNITKQFVGEMSGFEGKEVRNLTSLGLEGAVGLHLLDVKDNGDDIDGLMGLSISLDEWMQLDMGIVEEEYELSDRTSKILAAHHAKSTEFSNSGSKDDKRGKNSGRRWGLLESNFTVALMVQLRDPLRNYEPVGTPMLALIQVERVFLPPKPKIYCTVSDKSKTELENESDTEIEPVPKLEKENAVDVIPQFKVCEVHVAGLKAEPEKKKHWGNSIQQQSGSRWLLANGMGKYNKHPLMKSNTSNKISQLTTKVQPEETLWSISSRVNGNGSKWKEVPASKPHKRNPNFLFFR